MAMPASLDLVIPRGTDYELRLYFVDDATGAPLDLSGRTYVATYRAGATTVGFEVDHDELAQGVVVLRLARALTAALPPRARWRLLETAGGKVRSPLRGDLQPEE